MDTLLESERLNKPKERNVLFQQNRGLPSPKDFSSYKNLSVKSLPNIALGGELLVQYRKNFKFNRQVQVKKC